MPLRETSLVTCSPLNLPVAEREAIEQTIRQSRRNREGRLDIRYPDLVIEPHLDGFLVHTSAADWAAATRPDMISPALWAILKHAVNAGASWVSFDREEAPSDDFPQFPPA